MTMSQMSTSKNPMKAAYDRRFLLMKMMRTVSRLTSMMRAKNISRGSTTQVYIAESKNAGMAMACFTITAV
ncbi:MAG: hypothetical protein BWX71_00690 [Deltaproteobacteria bacterium ADurb.Bin072]|nr:MAG: hypothetical protein BWX71_00690 [Deltaproteobacteria bacterium ADurb.Bin072]